MEGSFDVDIIKKQHNTVDNDSNVGLDEDISNSTDHDENDVSCTEIMKRRAFRKNIFSFVYSRNEILFAFYNIFITYIFYNN